MKPLAILGAGMMTGVGLTAPATCAAIRCAIDRFDETRFMDSGAEWIIGSEVPLAEPWRGRPKLVQLAAGAIRECLEQLPGVTPQQIPLLLCVAEPTRPGRFDGLDDALLPEIERELGVQFHANSAVIAQGRTSTAAALQRARDLASIVRPTWGAAEQAEFCLIAAADTFLTAATLAEYESRERLLTSRNSNGFIPGEAGSAVLVGPAVESDEPQLVCLGVGAGQEDATIDSEKPLRADGLAGAIKAALADAGASFDDLHYRIADVNGEQYAFKEATLALARTMHKVKPEFDIWTPADCIGETGAAAGPILLGIALAAARKSYAPGPGVLCHFAGDGPERQAVVLAYRLGRAA